MTNLRCAINYIESKLNRRADPFKPYDNMGRTALTVEEASHVLNLLRTHHAQEDTLQFDMEMVEAPHRMA